MFESVTATRFIRAMDAGRTCPALVECERTDGSSVEVIVKCSDSTMQKVRDLAVEAICGMLARDLDLHVPEFFAVDLEPDFIATVRDVDLNAYRLFAASDSVAFGSRKLPDGFAVWGRDQPVPKKLCVAAAEIYAFDAIVINADRRPGNPNCLFSGSRLAIIDHELCFMPELFWKAPWTDGGFDSRRAPEAHIFAKPRLAQCPTNLNGFKAKWRAVDQARVAQYFAALPPSWMLEPSEVKRIQTIIIDSGAHIDQVVQRALEALQ